MTLTSTPYSDEMQWLDLDAGYKDSPCSQENNIIDGAILWFVKTPYLLSYNLHHGFY